MNPHRSPRSVGAKDRFERNAAPVDGAVKVT
jgi:hypothetical protein